MKIHYKRLTQDEFNQIKMFFSVGVKPSAIHKLTTRSESMLGLVKKANTFEEYLKTNAEYRRLKEEAKKPLKIEPTEDLEIKPEISKPQLPSEEIIRLLTESNKIMKEMINEIVYIRKLLPKNGRTVINRL